MPRLGYKKRIAFLALFLLALGICATPFILHRGADAAVTQGNVSFHDYTEYPTVLPVEYRNARIYWQDDTEITVYNYIADSSKSHIPSVLTTDAPTRMAMNENNTNQNNDPNWINPIWNPLSTAIYYMPVGPGNHFTALIENSSARDNNNEPVDVVVRIDQIVNMQDYADDWAYVYIDKYLCGTDVANPTGDQCKTYGTQIKDIGPGDPIIFWFGAKGIYMNVSFQYIKKGTFNRSSLSGTPAGISNLSLVSWDYDHVVSSPGSVFSGAEGYAVYSNQAGETAYYYNADTNIPRDGNGKALRYFMIPSQQSLDDQTVAGLSLGNSTAPYSNSHQYDGIGYNNSFIALASGFSDSKYQFLYTTDNAGAGLMIGGAAAYDIPNPTKSFRDDTIQERLSGQRPATSSFNYYIVQEPIIENTSNDALSFIALSNNGIASQQPHLDHYEIVDTFDEDISITSAGINVVLEDIENGQRVNADTYFNISVTGQNDGRTKVSVTAKEEYINTIRDKRIIVSYAARIVSNPEKNVIPNSGNIIYHYDNRTCEESGGTEIPGTENCTKNTNTVTVDLLNSITVHHYYDDSGVRTEFTDVSDILCDDVVANSNPRNNSAECLYTSTYKTNPLSPTGYRLDHTDGDAVTGTLSAPKVVNYYYVPAKMITVYHMVKTGNTWTPQATVITDIECDGVVVNATPRENSASCDIGVGYSTTSAFIPGYTLVPGATTGTPNGTLDDDETVTYYYEPNIVSVKINKTVKGNAGDTNRSFDVYIAITPAEGQEMPTELSYENEATGDSDTASVENGVATISVKHNDEINISMPADLTISVSEGDYSNEGYEASYSPTLANITDVLSQDAGEISIINTREFAPPTGVSSHYSPSLFIVCGMAGVGVVGYFVIKLRKSFKK